MFINVNETQKETNVFNIKRDDSRIRKAQKPQHERRRDLMKERIAAQEREMRIREMEDQFIQKMHEEIVRIENDDEKSGDLKNISIAMINDQINQVYLSRAEREQTAIEMELQRQQQEMDERMRENERKYEKKVSNKNKEELEAEQERSMIRGFSMINISKENISALSRTRASLSAAATRIRGEADYDMRWQKAANDEILAHAIKNKTGVTFFFDHSPLPADGFKYNHLQNLNKGISRLSADINRQVGALYRESQKLQEEQLSVYREKSKIPERNEDESENTSIDMRL